MRTYELMACPRVYPGQVLVVRLTAEPAMKGLLEARLRLRHYDGKDQLVALDAPEATALPPGKTLELAWQIPDLGGQPVAEVGLVPTAPRGRAAGRVLLDRMSWQGTPELTLVRPAEGGDFWWRAWVNARHLFSKHFRQDFRISQDAGEGMILQGTRDWRDYAVEADMMLHLGNHGSLVFRAQGQRRFYAARLTRDGRLCIVRRRDEEETVLAATACAIPFETAFTLRAEARGARLRVRLGDVELSAEDAGPEAFDAGAIGLAVHEGALSATRIHVGAA